MWDLYDADHVPRTRYDKGKNQDADDLDNYLSNDRNGKWRIHIDYPDRFMSDDHNGNRRIYVISIVNCLMIITGIGGARWSISLSV